MQTINISSVCVSVRVEAMNWTLFSMRIAGQDLPTFGRPVCEMTMSENRECIACTSAKIFTWSCPINRYATALCRAAMLGSTAWSMWVLRQLASIAAPSARQEPRNSRTVHFLARLRRPRKQAFVPVYVAGQRLLRSLLHGAEHRIPYRERWLLSTMALSTATMQT